MDSLSLTQPGGLPTSSLSEPEAKSPGLAFLLSIFMPGLGQVYCRQKGRAFWTFIFFVLGVACVVFLSSAGGEEGSFIVGLGLRTALVLYGFSFLDAYFTAQEMSDGTY